MHNIYNTKFQRFYDSKCLKNRKDLNLLFVGPPGVGKTTYSNMVAQKLNTELKYINAASINSKQDLYNILVDINEFDVLFIDEVHLLQSGMYEVLYNVMESSFLNIIYTFDEISKILNLEIPKFTFICATSNDYSIPRAFYDRFDFTFNLFFLSEDQMYRFIVDNQLCELSEAQIQKLIEVSHGIPRVCKKLLKLIEDIDYDSDINSILDLNILGLNDTTIRYINILGDVNVCSLKVICSKLGLNSRTVEFNIEPLLIRFCIIDITRKGRILTDYGKEIYEQIIAVSE